MNTETIHALKAPFSASQIFWGVGWTTEDKKQGQAIPHIDARAVQDRLDEVLGPANWKNEFVEVVANGKLVAIRCILSLRVGEEWLAKEDAAPIDAYSDERMRKGAKGGYTDALKRAAVQWGIGRYLYAYAPCWLDLDERGRLKEQPVLPDSFLPVGEQGKAPAPKVAQEAKVAVAEPSPPPSEAHQAVTAVLKPDDAVATTTPEELESAIVDTAMQASGKEQPAASPAIATPAAETPASEVSADFSVEALPEKERALVEDMLVKIQKIPAQMVRAYLNGPKGKEKLTEASRNYLFDVLEKHVAAQAA